MSPLRPRLHKSSAFDKAQTPPALALAICKQLAKIIPAPRQIVEPSAGLGHFVAAAKRTWSASTVVAIERDPALKLALEDAGADEVLIEDFLDVAKYSTAGLGADLILGMPPLDPGPQGKSRDTPALVHTLAAFEMLRPDSWLALLLPVSFLCGRWRGERLWKRPGWRAMMPIVDRPCAELKSPAVFVWQRGYEGYPLVLPHLFWRR